MKQLLLFLIFLPLSLTAQWEIQFGDLQQAKSAYRYPIMESEDVYEFTFTYTSYPVSVIEDLETGRFFKHQLERPKKYTSRKEWNALLKSRTAYSFINRGYSEGFYKIPPSLDSLKDGRYAQYYSVAPIFRNDTLFAVDTCVSAIFHIKNGLLDGEATWYLPNGMILQTGSYTAGKRSGTWTRYALEEKTNKATQFWEIHTITTAEYENNMWNGVFTKTDRFSDAIQEEKTTYVNSVRNGNYSLTYNGEMLRSGTYTNGKETGTWVVNHRNGEDKVVPFQRYTLNTDSVVHFSAFPVFIPFHEIEKEEDFYEDFGTSHQTLSLRGLPFQTPSLTDWCEALNCIQYTYFGTIQEKISPYAHNIQDSTGKYYEFGECAEKCGLRLNYTGKYQEYHTNGQLRFEIDLDNPKNYFNFTVYYPDGNPECIFKSLTDTTFAVSWYDSLHVLSQYCTYHKYGEMLSQLVGPKQLVRNGITYTVGYKNDFYYDPNPRFYALNKDSILQYSWLSAKDSSLLREDYFFPKQRLVTVQHGYSSPEFSFTEHYQFDSTFRQVDYRADFRLGELTMQQHTVKDLSIVSYLETIFPKPGDSLVAAAIINNGNLRSESKMNTLLYKGKPFTGMLEINYDKNATQLTLKASAKKIRVTLTPKEAEANSMLHFFTNIRELLDGNSTSTGVLHERDSEFVSKVTLANCQLQFVEGKLNGESRFSAKDKLLLGTYQFKDNQKNGIQIQYVFFPRSFTDYPSISKGEHIKYFISSKETFAKGKPEGEFVRLKSKTDTTLYGYRFNGKIIGKPCSFENSYAGRFRTYNYFEDTLLKHTTVIQLENRKIIAQNEVDKVMRSYHKNGQLAQELFYTSDSDSICIAYFDTTGVVRAKVYFNDQKVDYADFYSGYQKKATVDFYNSDSLDFDSGYTYEGIFDLVEAPFFPIPKGYSYWMTRTSLTYPTGSTVFFKNQRKVAEGKLDRGEKTGSWNYYDASGKPTTTMFYKDTLINGYENWVGTRTEYDANGKVSFQSNFVDFEKDYSCFEDTYVEQYQLYYSIYNYLPVKGTTVDHTNYYTDGVPMSTGQLIDGQPNGLWKMYRYDGSLYKMGVYDHGKKVGRWLKGDLSKLHFMGETCLDAGSEDFQQMLKEIDVEVEFYEDGKRMTYDYYQYRSPGLE